MVLIRDKVNADCAQVVQDGDQVFKGTAEAVQLPDKENVKAPARSGFNLNPAWKFRLYAPETAKILQYNVEKLPEPNLLLS